MAHFTGPYLVIDNDGYLPVNGLDVAELLLPVQGYVKVTHIIDPFGQGMFDMIEWKLDPERAILN